MKKVVLLFLAILSSFAFGCSRMPEYDVPTYDNDNIPTIDFMQPWAFYKMTEEELNNHFRKLSEKGFNTVIIQNVANYDNGVGTVCYYETEQPFVERHSDFLDKAINSAKNFDIRIVVGTSNDECWWQIHKHSFNDKMLEGIYEEEIKLIDEVLANYPVDGVYYANEMFSNPLGYEKRWAKHLNAILDYLTANHQGVSFWISPFNSPYFPQSDAGKARMWDNFFKAVNFRKGDLFLLQDGFGFQSSTPTKKQMEKVYNLDLHIRNSFLSNCEGDFALNIEYFAKNGYASEERMKVQTEYANKLGNVIACFSYSHYFA